MGSFTELGRRRHIVSLLGVLAAGVLAVHIVSLEMILGGFLQMEIREAGLRAEFAATSLATGAARSMAILEAFSSRKRPSADAPLDIGETTAAGLSFLRHVGYSEILVTDHSGRTMFFLKDPSGGTGLQTLAPQAGDDKARRKVLAEGSHFYPLFLPSGPAILLAHSLIGKTGEPVGAVWALQSAAEVLTLGGADPSRFCLVDTLPDGMARLRESRENWLRILPEGKLAVARRVVLPDGESTGFLVGYLDRSPYIQAARMAALYLLSMTILSLLCIWIGLRNIDRSLLVPAENLFAALKQIPVRLQRLPEEGMIGPLASRINECFDEFLGRMETAQAEESLVRSLLDHVPGVGLASWGWSRTGEVRGPLVPRYTNAQWDQWARSGVVDPLPEETFSACGQADEGAEHEFPAEKGFRGRWVYTGGMYIAAVWSVQAETDSLLEALGRAKRYEGGYLDLSALVVALGHALEDPLGDITALARWKAEDSAGPAEQENLLSDRAKRLLAVLSLLRNQVVPVLGLSVQQPSCIPISSIAEHLQSRLSGCRLTPSGDISGIVWADPLLLTRVIWIFAEGMSIMGGGEEVRFSADLCSPVEGNVAQLVLEGICPSSLGTEKLRALLDGISPDFPRAVREGALAWPFAARVASRAGWRVRIERSEALFRVSLEIPGCPLGEEGPG
jgi:hypothetical protein